MKTNLILLIIATLFLTNSFSQDQCATMKNLDEQIKKDPTLKARLIDIENKNQKWIEINGLDFKKHTEAELNKNLNNNFKTTLNTNDLCGYDNSFFTTIAAPTTLNQIISPTPNCTWAGEYVRVANLIAGRTYRISTIGLNNFDTQLTIYPAGGGGAVAFNDDWQLGVIQSEIYFTPILSGDYDLLIDKIGCSSEQICASLEVELRNIPRPIITIPVVVNVIHNGEAIGTGSNISDAQIQSQINVLNEDFRRLNQNLSTTSAAFRGTSADTLIQFCLAQQTPDGTPTNGINRVIAPTQTQYIQLGVPTELQCLNMFTMETVIKPATIWNSEKYLNIWVSSALKQLPQPNGLGCSNESETLGYAQFPGMSGPFPSIPSNLTDGVWIKYTAFGKIGNVNAPFNLGRTATHEIGHWLNLKHIWGDDTTANPPLSACAQDDNVADTPLQSSPTYGFNTVPYYDNNCIPATYFPGIMFMNYMDYSDDNSLSLFTYGQTIKMDATLFNQRSTLLTSQGCLPGSYKVVISQVYGGGGNAGATYNNDYIELYNRGTVAQNLNGWSVQYTSATGPTTGNTWFTTPLPDFTLQPGKYFLIKCAGSGTNNLPTEDFISTISLSSTTGKVILVNNTTAETVANPTGSQIIDKVGYGTNITTTTGYEGSSPTGTLLSNTTAAFRKLNGCTDTDSNSSDFEVGTPSPRNSSSPINLCSSLSVSQNTIETITLYPNPTSSKVFFDNSNTSFKDVTIYNYLGQVVSKSAITSVSNNQEIDFSDLSTGVYIVKFSNNGKSQSVKVVKQ